MQRSNAAALFAVVLTVLPPLLGTGFYGALVSALAFLTTGVVAAFFYFTFWMGEVIDLSLQLRGVTIPPESYPIILLTAWTLLQRAKAHWRPRDGRYGP